MKLRILAHGSRDRRLAPVLIGALIAALWTAAPAPASNIVYSISQSGTVPITGGENSPLSDTVSGSITTDGTIGVLQSSDILSWNLQLSDYITPANSTNLTPSNSALVEDTGSGLTASAAALSFNFSNSGAEFLIQGTTFGAFSGYQYFCFSATGGACAAGETIVPYNVFVDGVQVALTGTQPLTPVPAPATLSLLSLGLAAVSFMRRRKRGEDTIRDLTR